MTTISTFEPCKKPFMSTLGVSRRFSWPAVLSPRACKKPKHRHLPGQARAPSQFPIPQVPTPRPLKRRQATSALLSYLPYIPYLSTTTSAAREASRHSISTMHMTRFVHRALYSKYRCRSSKVRNLSISVEHGAVTMNAVGTEIKLDGTESTYLHAVSSRDPSGQLTAYVADMPSAIRFFDLKREHGSISKRYCQMGGHRIPLYIVKNNWTCNRRGFIERLKSGGFGMSEMGFIMNLDTKVEVLPCFNLAACM